MILAIASGKGGTGKTTLAVSLAVAAPGPVTLLDGDVEEPNCHLFFDGTPRLLETVSILVPEIDEARCDGCGACSAFCRYRAIAAVGARPLVFPELCHGCGGCALVCPRQAIRETGRRIGVIEELEAGPLRLVQGRLDVGRTMAPPLIRALSVYAGGELTILDAPPGTSCPVVAALRPADLVLLVTDPTPFGLHDLALAVEVVRELAIPFGVVVNRAGSGDERARDYCRTEGIPLLLEIPDERRIAEGTARGRRLIDIRPDLRARLAGLPAEAAARAAGTAGQGRAGGRP